MKPPPWWTQADAAETDVLLNELVAGYFEHRSWCREHRCPHVGDAIDVLLDWRRRRRLLSRARYLRTGQELADFQRIIHAARATDSALVTLGWAA